ncbi:MAG: hypothetical protein GQ534_08240 [Candidatus Delongbacteria bacterium]|nr:hypothetical protein [Candidatus Delongbacteria bacterium]
MGLINFYAAWIGIALGFVTGAVLGLFFHGEDWAGGYSSWRRRMMRLGHISFFGLAFINISYALSVKVYELQVNDAVIAWLFIIGAIAMPTVCFLSAYKKPFRHLFFIPVVSLVSGIGYFIFGGMIQ